MPGIIAAMETYRFNNVKVTLGQRGPRCYTKASYPVRYGRYSSIEYGDFLFQFTLNGEIKYISGTGSAWPHPAEWLKRTIGNDWVYYSTGSYYTGVVDLFGEYYLPCPSYPTNSLFKENPFDDKAIAAAVREFGQLGNVVSSLIDGAAIPELRDFLGLVGRNSAQKLGKKADLLHRLLKARVSVLPPDCRHVDYDVIPLMITDGCLYNCAFCEVKTGQDLTFRTRQDFTDQLLALKEFFGPDLQNYNSIYLGQHDALAAGSADIIFAAEQAYALLEIKESYMKEPKLFLFGSAESFLNKEEDFWRSMNRLPFYTFVNLGLESFDAATLELLKKPVHGKVMQQAFTEMLAVNRRYENIEVTANFLLGDALPADHIPALVSYIGSAAADAPGKGCLYISPLKGSQKTKELLAQFRAIKQKNRMQTYLYLIQRL